MSVKHSQMSIWVVLPTYNGATHLREQLKSIAQQDRPPDGLVASDDGSTDDTVHILEEFARHTGFPVTVLRQPHNVGLLSNLETALDVALRSADVIAFADQDDVWHPEKLTRVERAFADPSILMWFSDAEFIDSGGRSYGARLWQALGLRHDTDLNEPRHLMRFLIGQTITGTAMAARTSLIRGSIPFPRTREIGEIHLLFLHDGWLGLLAHLRGGIVLESAPMTQYRQHEGQYTGMSLLNAAQIEHKGRHRSLDDRVLLQEAIRLREIERHLRRPQSLDFLGGTLPERLLDRVEHSTSRAAVIDGQGSPLDLLRMRHQYDLYANGWQTLGVDTLRYVLRRVTRRRRSVR